MDSMPGSQTPQAWPAWDWVQPTPSLPHQLQSRKWTRISWSGYNRSRSIGWSSSYKNNTSDNNNNTSIHKYSHNRTPSQRYWHNFKDNSHRLTNWYNFSSIVQTSIRVMPSTRHLSPLLQPMPKATSDRMSSTLCPLRTLLEYLVLHTSVPSILHR